MDPSEIDQGPAEGLLLQVIDQRLIYSPQEGIVLWIGSSYAEALFLPL